MGSQEDLIKPPKKKSNSTKWIALTIIVLLVATITLAVLFAQEMTRDPNEGYVDNTIKVCLTKECVSAAASLVTAMNDKVDPCEDFYEFACGNWNQSEPMPDDRARWQIFDVLRRNLLRDLRVDLSTEDGTNSLAIKKAQQYYKTCINMQDDREKNFKALREHLKEYAAADFLQSWPFGDKEMRLDQIYISMLKTAKKYGNNAGILNNFILAKAESPREYIINFEAPSFTLSRSQLIDADKQSIRDAYVEYGAGMTKLYLELVNSSSSMSDSAVDQMFNEILNFEVELAKSTLAEAARRNESELLHPYSLADFTTEFQTGVYGLGAPDWVNYFNEAWGNQTKPINESTVVNVREPIYYRRLSELFREQPNLNFALNYFGWKIIEPLLTRVNDDFLALASKLRRAQTGATSDVPHWERCIDLVNDHLPNAVGIMYSAKHFREEAKQELDQMIDYLFKAFEEIVKESYWMTEQTRKVALRKAEKMQRFIAYNEDLLPKNSNLLDAEHDLFKEADSYLENFVRGREFQTRVQGEKYVNGNSRTDWITGSAIVNAFYEPTQNSISFPAGILQAPFLGQGYPKFWNFAAIGTVIGHEITHGFDDQGSMYDEEGALDDWWDPSSRAAFKDRAQTIIDQYSGYSYLGVQLNGTNNQGENIADNGGLRESYRGYKLFLKEVLNGAEEHRLPGFEHYTTDQMFYLSYAQIWCGDYRKAEMEAQVNRPHSPGRFRIIGPLQNSPEFSRAYRCRRDDYMNPIKKNAVW